MISSVATLYHLLRGARGTNHAERLDDFYRHQAADYDRFRERLLHGRQRLIDHLPVAQDADIVDVGGGTGANLERFGARLAQCRSATILDLCQPLLTQAELRCQAQDWRQVRCVHGDACTWQHPEGIDLAICSYSLSMIPDWFAALENLHHQLRPGGIIGVVDFYVSRKHVAPGRQRHNWFTRHFWPAWFGHDNVMLRNDLLPWLEQHFETIALEEHRGSLPFLPGARVPYCLFIGRRPA